MLFRGGGRLFLVPRNLHGFANFWRFSGAGKFARLQELRGRPDPGNFCAFFPAREICLDLLIRSVFLERANLRRPAAPSAPRGSKRAPRLPRPAAPSVPRGTCGSCVPRGTCGSCGGRCRLVRAALLPQWRAFLDGFCGPRVPLGFYVPRPLRAARARGTLMVVKGR